MTEWPPYVSKEELNRLIEDRKNDLPIPQPELTPGGPIEDAVKREKYENQQEWVHSREERIQYSLDRFDQAQDRAKNDFERSR